MRRFDSLAIPLGRLHAIDWMRGLVMLLMVIDHASGILNPGRVMPDSIWIGALGAPLPAAQFLTRWITHLCAPTFIFLAGTSLALRNHRLRAQGVSWRTLDRHLLVRGGLLVALELWMALGFGMLMFQVLYALGAGMIAMVALRSLPRRALLAFAIAWMVGSEAAATALGVSLGQVPPMWTAPFMVPFVVPKLGGFLYPALAWLPVMILGFLYGEHLVRSRDRVKFLLGFAAIAFTVFIVQRLFNGYGNYGLARTDDSLLRWLQVSKYPPSLAYFGLELGILFVALAACFGLSRGKPWEKNPLLVFGQTALFFYVIHIHLLRVLGLIVTGGYGKPAWPLWASFVAAAWVLAVLYPLCVWFRRFKVRNPKSFVRFL